MMRAPKTFRDYFHMLQWKAFLRGGSTRYYKVYRNKGRREALRRFITDAHEQQLNSHKPGTVQPRHIFGGAR